MYKNFQHYFFQYYIFIKKIYIYLYTFNTINYFINFSMMQDNLDFATTLKLKNIIKSNLFK